MIILSISMLVYFILNKSSNSIALPHYTVNGENFYVAKELHGGLVMIIKDDYHETKKFKIEKLDDINKENFFDMKIPSK